MVLSFSNGSNYEISIILCHSTKKTNFPFREQASIFSRLGFDGLFFGRLDWRDKDTRIQNQTMEVIWKGIENKTV